MTIATLTQVFIALFGVSAIFFSQCATDRWRRWASVCGLLGQPAWLISSFLAGQWGIFILSFLYAAAWCKGFHTYWIANK
jgi:hypothetical protein